MTETKELKMTETVDRFVRGVKALARLCGDGGLTQSLTRAVIEMMDDLSDGERVQVYQALGHQTALKLVQAGLDQSVSAGLIAKDSTGRYWSVEAAKPKGSA